MITRGIWNFPELGVRSAFEELERMRRQLDELFERFDFATPSRIQRAGVYPLTNITETTDEYIIRAELPGVSADALDIQATGRQVSISGERKIEAAQNVRYHRRERDAGSFARVVTLPGDIDRDGISASLENGILTIRIPKAEAAKPKKIAIK